MQTEVCECDSVSINRPGEIRPDISFNSCNHIFGPGAFRSAADTAFTIELVSSYFSLSMAYWLFPTGYPLSKDIDWNVNCNSNGNIQVQLGVFHITTPMHA